MSGGSKCSGREKKDGVRCKKNGSKDQILDIRKNRKIKTGNLDL
jgi:hypothetical protein